MVDGLVQFFAPWATWYGDSAVLPTAVTFAHVAGLLWGGGRAVTADLMTIRAPGLDGYRASGGLRFMAESHRDVVAGLVVSALSGVALSTADLEHFLSSGWYAAKLAAVFLLLVNGLLLRKREMSLRTGSARDQANWQGARRHAAISLALWFSAALIGLALVNE